MTNLDRLNFMKVSTALIVNIQSIRWEHAHALTLLRVRR